MNKSAGCTRAKRSVARKQFRMYLRAIRYDHTRRSGLSDVFVKRALHVLQTETARLKRFNTAALGPDSVQRIRIAARANPRLRKTGLS